MNTIAVNTSSGAVTEYDWAFTSLSANHAASDAGVFALGGGTDAGTPIASRVMTGRTLQGDGRQKLLDTVFFGMQGEGQGTLLVAGEGAPEYQYPFIVRAKGESRAQPGRGIKENYLAVGFANVDGADFSIDSIEAPMATSKTRRST